MAHIPGDRPYTVTHKSRVASYILTHAHEHPECTPWHHRGKPHRLSPRARARQQAAAEACCCLCIKAQPRCTDPRQSATSRAHATVRPRLGSPPRATPRRDVVWWRHLGRRCRWPEQHAEHRVDDVDELQRHGRSSVARSAPAPSCAERWALCAEMCFAPRTGVYSTGTVEPTDLRTQNDDAGARIGLRRRGCAALSRRRGAQLVAQGGRTLFKVFTF